jgi:uncharacterized protein (DUF1800 family)
MAVRIALPAVLLVACASSHPVRLTETAKTVAPPPAPVVVAPAKPLPANGWTEEQRAMHALSRFAFGPRPGDVVRVAKMGTAAWLKEQLAPGGDPIVEAKIAKLPSAKLSVAELLDEYPPKKKTDPGDGTPRELGRELATAKIVRAVESSRQLEEVLVDFWFNHFNVDERKGAVKWMVGPYERDAIRAHVFGTFRELLGATAKHPAMLFYLDNWLSTAQPNKASKKARGLNENYARELLELHTLGVDGGYAQNDVREVARAFTGWTIEKPRLQGTFVFRPALHDRAEKTILGTKFEPAGVNEGDAVLDLLAKQPKTARFIATALARRFVSDDPPTSLIDRVSKAFLDSNGDLRTTYEALFYAPETWSDAARKSKVKDPFETVVSAIRAVGGTVALGDVGKKNGVQPLVATLDAMGEPLYRCQPPTGFPEKASAWTSTGALVTRIRFAIGLTEDRFQAITFDRDTLAKGEGALVDRVAHAILHEDLAPATRTAIEKELEAMPDDDERRLSRAIALVLGSPDFQRQ